MAERINGNHLIGLGYEQGPVISVALKINKKRNGLNREQMLEGYQKVLTAPELFLEDPVFEKLATALITDRNKPKDQTIPLLQNAASYAIYGADQIEDGATEQMATAMKLPITVAGALMPDAHKGYGLPIGGVLAVKNAVIPYGVGVDIGCRMALSVFDIPETYFASNRELFRKHLITHTKFGAGNGFTGQYKAEHGVLDNPSFNMNSLISGLKDKAWTQLGSSGGGNHFVEFGIIDFQEDDAILRIARGRYLALLSHSGSRGFGATIAGHYTKMAKDICQLPWEASNLAYLDLDSSAGQEYWIAMNLAGDYASACHEIIHQKIGEAIGGMLLAKVENHHNFAWREQLNGEEVIVHRKGATPAGKGIMGIIPGSMATPGFLVRGNGVADAINSASHGAGRRMSRTAAIRDLSGDEMRKLLLLKDVTLIGASIDEAPMAYKNIENVMEAQSALVETIAKFNPKIVRMADDGSRED